MTVSIIVTTSDAYHHILPYFFRQYNKYWGDPFELVGYKKPEIELPDNCTWVSLGVQRGPKFFSEDLRLYFEKQPQYFVWLFEDSLLKSFDRNWFSIAIFLAKEGGTCGRFNLTTEGMRRPHEVKMGVYIVPKTDPYRLSTQPSIWNKDFLLKYLTPGLNPWQFETQSTNDDYKILGLINPVLTHNEGVTKKDIYKIDLTGIE